MAGNPWFDDEVWDEERWETFLRENDRRIDHYMELFFLFMREHPRPGPDDADALEAWKQALRAFLQDKGWRRDDLILPFLWLDEDVPEDAEGAPAFGAGEMLLDEEDAGDDLDDVQQLPVYQHAFQLTSDVLDWAHALSDDVKDSTIVYFCSHITQVPANIARGYGIGHERDALGGNIACAKRGLAEANAALGVLLKMKQTPYMDAPTYRRLYEQVYEVRNELGLYVQDLRDRFNLGID